MKKTLITVAAFAAITFFSVENVFTNQAQPEAGRTGAPGETTCATSGCHSGSPITTSSIALLRGASTPLTEYSPGTTYNVIINVNQLISPSGTTPKNGFEVIALDGSNNMAGSFNATNTTQTVKLTVGPKQYIAHKNATSLVAWAFQWTAPAIGTGPVSFYVAVNMSNNNNTTSGDNIYKQTFTVTEADPCDSYNVNISAPGNDFSVCPSGNLTITATVAGASGTPSYSWSTGGNTAAITVSSPGTYRVTVSDGTCTDSASVAVTAAVGANASFTTSVSGNVVTITDGTTGNAVDYTWDYDNGDVAGTNGSHTYVYPDTGSYTITLEVVDACGDTSLDKRLVTISNITVGVTELLAENVSIYPNPFSGNVKMDLTLAPVGVYTLHIVDLAGMTALSTDLTGGMNHEIETAGLPDGMYFYQLRDENAVVVKSGRLLAQ